jgi:hypothetical protein
MSYATIKYDENGNQLWLAIYNGSSWDFANSLAVDAEGNVYVTGESIGAGTSYDFATIKYNTSGEQQWVQRYSSVGTNSEKAYSLAIDTQSNVYVTGFRVQTGPNYNMATVKYNSAGQQQWVALYNGPADSTDVGRSIAVDANGNVFVAGESYSDESNLDYCVIKYSSAVIPNWQQPEALTFGTPEAVAQYALHPNYPNPFNAATVISYELRSASLVMLNVYDVAGREVAKIVDGWREAGTHEVTFDASSLTSGMYFCKLQAGDFTAVQKMVLIK